MHTSRTGIDAELRWHDLFYMADADVYYVKQYRKMALLPLPQEP